MKEIQEMNLGKEQNLPKQLLIVFIIATMIILPVAYFINSSDNTDFTTAYNGLYIVESSTTDYTEGGEAIDLEPGSTYTVGTDIEPGNYDLTVTSGDGSIIGSFGLEASLDETESNFYDNLILTEGDTLALFDVSVSLTPQTSENIEEEILEAGMYNIYSEDENTIMVVADSYGDFKLGVNFSEEGTIEDFEMESGDMILNQNGQVIFEKVEE